MRASGNGAPDVCANNLLRTFRGEVPFERVKGINPRLIDRPSSEVNSELNDDAEWLVNTYEPRVTLDGVTVSGTSVADGGFSITANITGMEG